MTVESYYLGRPLPAPIRGGDCRARDLGQGRNVKGMHRFVSPNHCQISNGLLRLSVGSAGLVPVLTVEGRRGVVTVGDVYVDTYADLYGGGLSTPEWVAMGDLTIDSPSVAAVLTGVQLSAVSDESVTIRLVAPLIGDAWVTLERGMRHASIQHGRSRGKLVNTARRLRWTASPSLIGTASVGRVEEVSAATDGFLRFVASIDAVTTDAGAFSITASSVTTADMGAGIGTFASHDQPADLHAQLGDDSMPELVVYE